MNREWLKWHTVRFCTHNHCSRNTIERCARHRRIRVISRWQQIAGVSSAGLQGNQDVHRLLRQIDVVRLRALHPFLTDRPDRILEIDFIPGCVLKFALANHREQDELQAQSDGWECRHVLKFSKHDPNFRRGQRTILWDECRDRGRTQLQSRIDDLLAV